MQNKDIWNEDYTVCIYSREDDLYYFYCNPLKIYKSKNKNFKMSDFFWDPDPNYATLMNYIDTLKVYNYLKLHKYDASFFTPKNNSLCVLKLTPEENNFLDIIF